MTNELAHSTTYSAGDIQDLIEAYPWIDERGEVPFTWDTSTQPPTQDANEDWIVTYDLNAAAADIWAEKASILAQDYDIDADGSKSTRSQAYEQAMKLSRYYRARRAIKTITQEAWPKQGVDQLAFNVNDPRI